MLSFLFLRVAVVFHLRYVKYIFSFNLLFVFSGITGLHLVFTKIQMLISRRVINLITLRQNVIPGSLLELKLREIKKIMQSLLSGHRARFYISPKHTFFFLALARIWKRHLTHLSSHFFQIPQRPGPGVGGATTSDHIEVFIDEECAEWVIRLILSVRLFTIITHFISHGHMHSDSDDHLNSSVESSSSQSYNEIEWIRRFSSICS